jgi:hypothetical protein
VDLLAGVGDRLEQEVRGIFGIAANDRNQRSVKLREWIIGLKPDEFRRRFFERFEFAKLQQQIALHGQQPWLGRHGFQKDIDPIQSRNILFTDNHSVDFLHLGKMFAALAKLDFLTVPARAQTVLIE